MSQLSDSVSNVNHPVVRNDASCSILPDFAQPMVQHKVEVPPIFLAYRRVSVEGVRIPLIQVASSVVQALHDDSALDTVQPM